MTLEDADEPAFWLAVIIAGDIAANQGTRNLFDEATQRSAIVAASSLTAI